jgi:hypothetical protein
VNWPGYGVLRPCVRAFYVGLNSVAGCDDLVVSNMLYQHLPETLRAEFEELPPVDVKNMGRVRAWKRGPSPR